LAGILVGAVPGARAISPPNVEQEQATIAIAMDFYDRLLNRPDYPAVRGNSQASMQATKFRAGPRKIPTIKRQVSNEQT